VKIATWNVNSLRVRLEHVLKWLEREQPDVLSLQETKMPDEEFPVEEFRSAGYHAIFSGQRTYNGVAILSREPPRAVSVGMDGFADEQKRVLGASFGAVRLWNLYVPNGESVDSDKYRYKLEWLAALRAHLAIELERHPLLAVCGDFNIAPEDRDVYDPARWKGHVLCSAPERAALVGIEKIGLRDLFRQFEQPPGSFSWWDYRAGAFRRNHGLRIDLLLASRRLSQMCTACRIDVEPRRWERPSDHVPVIAELATS
jgi:exodeoxyribonuclease-3